MTLSIPYDAILDDRLAIVGTAGSGKTYAAGVLTEIIMSGNHRAIIVDPLGVFWGLRMDREGETPSRFNPVIFGGRHGDLPITEQAGLVIGETAATMAESCIIDLSGLGTKASERRFMLAFLTALYRKTDGVPVHLIIDEADMFAPQQLLDKDGDAARLLGMMETIVRRGRIKGFVPWLISQRPAVLSKNVLSQADGLISFKLTSKQDRDAIGSWVEGQADKEQWKQYFGQLATLERGNGLVWIPGRGVLDIMTFPAKTTFDSSRTPKRGEAVSHKTLNPIDLSKIQGLISSATEDIKANDPKALKAEIARLKQELLKADRKIDNGNGPIDAAIKKAFEQGVDVGMDRALGSISGLSKDLAGSLESAEQAHNNAKRLLESFSLFIRSMKAAPKNNDQYSTPALPKPNRIVVRQAVDGRGMVPNKAAPPSNDEYLTGPQRKIMRSLMFWTLMGQMTPSREQVAGISGYSATSGSFRNTLSTLKTAGLIEYPSANSVGPTMQSGLQEMMLADEAKQILEDRFSGPQRKLLEVIRSKSALTREEVADRSGYSVSSGSFRNTMSSLRTLDVIDYPSKSLVALTDWARELLS